MTTHLVPSCRSIFSGDARTITAMFAGRFPYVGAPLQILALCHLLQALKRLGRNGIARFDVAYNMLGREYDDCKRALGWPQMVTAAGLTGLGSDGNPPPVNATTQGIFNTAPCGPVGTPMVPFAPSAYAAANVRTVAPPCPPVAAPQCPPEAMRQGPPIVVPPPASSCPSPNQARSLGSADGLMGLGGIFG